MTDDYTPTTEEVRADFAYPWYEHNVGDDPIRVAAFDRWLAAHDAAFRAEIAAEVADYADAAWDLIDTPNAARLAFEAIGDIVKGDES